MKQQTFYIVHTIYTVKYCHIHRPIQNCADVTQAKPHALTKRAGVKFNLACPPSLTKPVL